MDFLPQPRQAAGEQAVGLLAGMLADNLQLTQGWRNLALGHGRQAFQQLRRARQAQAVERDLQALGCLAGAGIAVVVGLTHDTEHQCRAVLHQFGDVAQRAAAIADGDFYPLVTGQRNWQAYAVEELDPGIECFWCLTWHDGFNRHAGGRPNWLFALTDYSLAQFCR
ncbi:hypothetical protein D3C80_1321450 [compost metagenome]